MSNKKFVIKHGFTSRDNSEITGSLILSTGTTGSSSLYINPSSESEGIYSDFYYGGCYTDNTYVQKKYVDDEIAAIPTPPLQDLQSVLDEGSSATGLTSNVIIEGSNLVSFDSDLSVVLRNSRPFSQFDLLTIADGSSLVHIGGAGIDTILRVDTDVYISNRRSTHHTVGITNSNIFFGIGEYGTVGENRVNFDISGISNDRNFVIGDFNYNIGGSPGTNDVITFDGTNAVWATPATPGGQVDSVSGVVGETIITGTAVDPIVGLATTITDDIALGVTAHGWGDHATQGYLTSYTESQDLADVLTLDNTTGANNIVVTDNSIIDFTATNFGQNLILFPSSAKLSAGAAGIIFLDTPTFAIRTTAGNEGFKVNPGTGQVEIGSSTLDGVITLYHDSNSFNINVDASEPLSGSRTMYMPDSDVNWFGATDGQVMTYDLSSNTWQPSTISTGTTDHGTLTGLGDDDHTQYHTDTRALTWLGTRSTDDLPEGVTNLYFPGFTSLVADYGVTLSTVATSGDHTDLSNIGTNTHAQIDSHIADSSIHFTQAAISITESQISDLGAYLESVNISDINATGTTNGTTFLRGDGVWATPPSGGGNTFATITGWISVQANGTVNNSNGITVSKGATGIYNYTFTNPQPNNDYAVSGVMTMGTGWTDTNISVVSKSTTGFTVQIGQGDNSTTTDVLVDEPHDIMVIGDSLGGSVLASGDNISELVNDSGYLTSFTETNDLTSAVVWANIPDANVPQSAVTQHETALTITESQISDLQPYLLAADLTGYLQTTDIDTLSELNSIITDATLIDTTDSRLSDARTPLAHTHVAADITDFDTEVSNNSDVTANTAKVSFPGFTSLLADYSFTDNSTDWDTAFGWGDHSTQGYLTSYTETNDLTAAVTWANIPDVNVPQTAVTQHQAALSITESQISDLGAYITEVEEDTSPILGGPLNGNGFDISKIGVLQVNKAIQTVTNDPAGSTSLLIEGAESTGGTHVRVAEIVTQPTNPEFRFFYENFKIYRQSNDSEIRFNMSNSAGRHEFDVNATGNRKWDLPDESGTLALQSNIPFNKSITIESPTGTEDITVWKTTENITITELNSVLLGSSTPSVTWTLRFASDRSATGNEVITSGTTVTSTTTGSTETTFNDATIPAGSWIWVETTAQSGTVDSLAISIEYTKD